MLNYIHVPSTTNKQTETDKNAIDALFADMATKGINDVTVYAHGGINSYKYGRERADALTEVLESQTRHVVTIVWETGVTETLGSQMKGFLDRPIINKFSEYVFNRMQKALPRDNQPGTLNGWGSSAEINENDLLHKALNDGIDSSLQENSAGINAQLEADFAKAIEGDRELMIEVRETIMQDNNILTPDLYPEKPSSDNSGRPGTLGFFDNVPLAALFTDISMKVAERFEKQRDHGRWTTVIEEVMRQVYIADVVKASWNDMKQRARTMWLENEGDSNAFKPSRYFLEKLVQYKKDHPGANINLVAHSAGSIVMCHFLDTVADQFKQLNINHVIFTAPAATFEQFYDAVVTKTERYKKFTLFTMSDEHEQQDAALPHLYPSSMLYLVSGVLEQEVDHPISGMMRFFTGKAPFDSIEFEKARQFLFDPNEERLVISKQPPTRSGLRVETIKHRDFDKDGRMLTSIRQMLDDRPIDQ